MLILDVQLFSVIPAETGHEVKCFSAIQKVVEALSWIPACAGMTLKACMTLKAGMTLKDSLK
jgi:hypothetical protein